MSAGAISVDVLLFASLGERAGRRVLTVSLPAGATAADVWAALPFAGDPPAGMRYAVDSDWAAADRALEDGDVVALITPVSGG